jgi:hypothetical protein
VASGTTKCIVIDTNSEVQPFNFINNQAIPLGKKFAYLSDRRIEMEIVPKKEATYGLRIFRINPFALFEDIFKKKRLKKREKELQLQLAIFSGGITRMK